MKKLSVHHIHHVRKCSNFLNHGAILVRTGRAHCFHDYLCVMPILLLQYLSTLCVMDVMDVLAKKYSCFSKNVFLVLHFGLTCLILKAFLHICIYVYIIYYICIYNI